MRFGSDYRYPGEAGHLAGSARLSIVSFITVLNKHFTHEDEWLLYEDTGNATLIVLSFRNPRFGLMELERDLNDVRAAGVRLDLRLVDPRLDRTALDSVYRLGGAGALLRAIA